MNKLPFCKKFIILNILYNISNNVNKKYNKILIFINDII